MKIQILSDLHLEEEGFNIPETDADVIVLAGDIHEGTRAIPWIQEQTDKLVIYVAGNHEFYGELCSELKYNLEFKAEGSRYNRIFTDEKTGKKLSCYCHQINFLEKREVNVIDKFIVHSDQLGDSTTTSLRFLGCTLWTPHEWSNIRYRQIGKIQSYSKIGPNSRDLKFSFTEFSSGDAGKLFEESLAWLGYKLREKPETPTVVVTHHAPSYKSNIMPDGEKYISDYYPDIQNAYMNELEEFIMEHQSNLKLWVHGHLHSSSDYHIGKTRVVCNPRGRGTAEEKNPDFDPAFTVEIEGR